MDQQQVVDIMRREGGFGSPDEAQEALRAALGALADRVSAGAVAPIAEALPTGVSGALRSASADAAAGGTGADLGAEVGRRLGTDEAAGTNALAAALRTVAAAVDDPQALTALRDQLPADLNRMLLQEREGDTSAVHSSVEAQRTREDAG
jgi:uncharacterized protein (DUF2267 family)